MNNKKQPKPFTEIDYCLMSDFTDSSNLEVDGIELCSCNEWDLIPGSGIPDELQQGIHSAIKRIAIILKDYRDGKLVYIKEADERSR